MSIVIKLRKPLIAKCSLKVINSLVEIQIKIIYIQQNNNN